ncbi:MAG: ABC transporter transmembrane domain-containing protein [Chloroflexota bacterium]
MTVPPESWEKRTERSLTFCYRPGSHAEQVLETVSARYLDALTAICAFLGVSQDSAPRITVYLCDELSGEPSMLFPGASSSVDLEAGEVWTVISSESAAPAPRFDLVPLVLRGLHGAATPVGRFWEDGLAGYLEAQAGNEYFKDAGSRCQKMREEGQLRPLMNVVRGYGDHRSPVTLTMAVDFTAFVVEWRGADRYKRFLLDARAGTDEAVRRGYGRPLAQVDQLWQRRMETAASAGGGKTMAALKGTFSLFLPYRWSVLAILLTILLGLAFDVFMPLAIRFVIDNILSLRPIRFSLLYFHQDAQGRIMREDQESVLLALLGVMVVMFAINTVARIKQAALTATVSQGVTYDLRVRFLEHLQRLPIAFHSRTPANDIVQRFQTDIAYVASVFSAGIVPLVSNGLAMLIFGLTLVSLNPWLSIVAIAGLPIFAFSYRQGRAAIRANTRETVRRNQEIQQSVIENMNAQTFLKLWSQRGPVMERFHDKLEVNRETNIRNTMVTQAFNRASVLITNAAQVAILIVGGLVVIWSEGRDLSAGGLMAFYVLLLRLYGPAGLFAGAFQTLSLSADGLERVGKVLDRAQEADSRDSVRLSPLRSALVFEKTTYAQTRGKNLLKDVDLTVTAGSRVAVVGPTGAGKATLLQLLPRLYDVTEGRILWDGVDLSTATRESVREQVVALPTDTFVLNLTIYENILVGNHNATETDVVAAARTAGLHEFILGLPGGYDTVVSDRDTAISTPNRQRLAAARALLRSSASLVVMEDPFSALEASAQREIEDALRGADGRRTVIKIAQRVGSVTDYDAIVVMDGGEVVDRGTHDELLDRCALYQQLIKDELGEAAVSGARQAVRRLGKLEPFSSLPPEVLEETARLLLYAERGPGEVICRQGSIGDELFIIGRGDVEIVVADDEGNENIVNVLSEGDYVGEISFLRRTPRTATVRAQTNVELHILRRLDFDALLERFGTGALEHMERTAQDRINDTMAKLAALSAAR